MPFRVLGSLEVIHEDVVLPFGGPLRGVLLAALLSEANKQVTDVALLRAMYGDGGWDQDREPQVLHALRVHITALRSVLDRANGRSGRRLVRRGDTYVLEVERDELDEFVFSDLVREARRRRKVGEATEAAEAAARALQLWRGDPLLNLRSTPVVDAYRERLRQSRLEAERERAAAYLAAGRHGALVEQLRPVVRDHHPADERLRLDLALALHRDGRPAEAAEECRSGLHFLHEQGLRSDRLAELQTRILRDDPSLRRRERDLVTVGRPTVPAQLPADAAHFVGRDDEVARLLATLRPSAPAGRRPAIATIAGKAGVGKTALAVHVGHQLRASYPDGAIYLNLQATSESPMSSEHALVSVLVDLGISREQIPDGVDGRAGLLRTTLAGRRAILILDNAASEEQARPLLPGSSASAVIVTSRRPLTGLDAEHVLLDVLRPQDAITLLADLAGRSRVAAEEDRAAEIVDLCGQLPLAVRIAGARLARWPTDSLQGLRDRLVQARLNVLHVGDLEVRASFDLSYQGLPDEHRRAFRLLAAPETEEVSLPAAAALLDDLGEDTSGVIDLLDSLAEVQLIDRRTGADGAPRYSFHDLLRLFARERLVEEESPAARRAALERVLETYLAQALRAAKRLLGGNRLVVSGSEPSRWPSLDPTGGPGDAAQWFREERADLVALVVQAEEEELDEHAWLLAAALIDFFDFGAHWSDWQRTHEAALRAATRQGHALAVANTRRNLARLLRLRGRRAESRRLLTESLEDFLRAGHALGEAAARRSLAELDSDDGQWDEAIRHLATARTLYQTVDEQFGSGRALMTLGDVYLAQGRVSQAITAAERAVHDFGAVGNRLCAEMAHKLLGAAYLHAGSNAAAIRELTRAADFFGAEGHPRLHAETLLLLGDAHGRQHDDETAFGCYERCLRIFEDRLDTVNRARTLASRGRLHAWRGEGDEARAAWEVSLAAFANAFDGKSNAEIARVRSWLEGESPGDRDPGGNERILDHFDVNVFSERVRHAEFLVKILSTWTDLLADPDRVAFLAALRSALDNGALAQILLLAPGSGGAAERTSQIGGELDVAALIETNLEHLRAFRAESDSTTGLLEIRLYSSGGFVAYYRADGIGVAATLPSGRSSRRTTQYEIPMDSALAQFVEQRFSDLWRNAEPFT